ncbi:hypothetical protein [Curtobacterium sp. VKM Ac-1376]|uniref:hypothetical protein n=1 Tax=Curtobacterium sp. VKM Ac-1376 TaxID=123312 RepID=UPI001889E48A|nr:hypothetical protein [Curtobacterium sp. VKM Ac-1376]MBF4613775.1 hypothetical protein [Curtobacterium sp. VKM Ac-1376]
MTMLAQPTTDSNTIVTQYGTGTIELPMMWVDARRGRTPAIGERYSVILEQRLNNPHMADQLRAERIDSNAPGHLGLNPQVGYQWGWDEGEPVELVFTVIGTYVLGGIVPNYADLSFDFVFRLETQAVSA